jgi:hypothetical protein
MKKKSSSLWFFISFLSFLVFFKGWNSYFLATCVILIVMDSIAQKKNSRYENTIYLHTLSSITLYFYLSSFFRLDLNYLIYLTALGSLLLYHEVIEFKKTGQLP